ncbi:MAG: L-glutamate gamma-semialdehyde dehydrogenase, partial [Geminicoccaceae bacterium]
MATDGLRPVHSPADGQRVIGEARGASAPELDRALQVAERGAAGWAAVPVDERSRCLERAADRMEERLPALMAIAVREAGKTIPDALAEVREAVDFLRYYAARARTDAGRPLRLRGASAGREVALEGGGVFACISPWNFPLAIFTGQIAAALAAGNAVLAKPAEQTPLIAAAGTAILLESGIPPEALQLLPGDGPSVGAPLVADPRIAGVCFTGSTEVARGISRTLAGRHGPPAVLVAETGGLNAMIVDSTALPEQVTRDVLVSAFQSAGQRCSALRLLCLQTDIAEPMLEMIAGAMDELQVGDPALLATDIGPVIDGEARAMLEAHKKRMLGEARPIKRLKPGPGTGAGTFVPPAAFEIDRIGRLEREVFGPILHVVRFRAEDLDRLVDAINATGYGLTLGLHTRIDATRQRVAARARVGNIYVNRNQIGALVGIQPFGGMGLSGTGPKAGGPGYLARFLREVPQAASEPPEVPVGLSATGLEAALATPLPEPPGLEARAQALEKAAAKLGEPAAATLNFLAAEARDLLDEPVTLPGPTGEDNSLALEPRGTFACIAADAAALAGQVAAALVTGNRALAIGPAAEAVAGAFATSGWVV